MELWERDSYKTPVKTLFNHRIVEYDMKSANTSIAREFGLLPEKRIKELENLPKKDREIAVGLILRDNPGYSEKQKLGFIAARKLFFTQNEILDEENIHDRVLETFREAIEGLVNAHIEPEGYITEDDKKEIIEFTKIKARKQK